MHPVTDRMVTAYIHQQQTTSANAAGLVSHQQHLLQKTVTSAKLDSCSTGQLPDTLLTGSC